MVSLLQSMALSSSVATWIAIGAARYLILSLLFFFPVLWNRGKQGKHILSEVVWSGGGALLLTAGISRIVTRLRPFSVEGSGISNLIPEPFNSSFPSSHTSVSFAIAAILLSFDRSLGTIAFGIAGVIAIGRIAVGVHYPSDIFGGMMIAAVVFFLVKFMHKQIWKKQ
ncbi:phosphatase PAP2 family protein [Candidatus Uhrbacteria bacterium]|nr:phosphatase PAP2 family protein [Candidatus Uhrbacteria bacterium]